MWIGIYNVRPFPKCALWYLTLWKCNDTLQPVSKKQNGIEMKENFGDMRGISDACVCVLRGYGVPGV